MALEIYTKQMDQLTNFEKLVRVGKMAREESEMDMAKALIKGIAQEVVANTLGDLSNVSNMTAVVLKRIAEIDKILSDYSNEVLHHPEFQKLEGSWRGLHKFVLESNTSDKLKILAFPTRRKELQFDLDNAVNFDQSALFKKIYEEEYGTFGGTPFSMLIGDFYFNKSPKDITLLEGLSSIAACAHTPFIGGVSPELFGMDLFLEMPNPEDLKSIFNSSEYMRWNSFRSRDDSKYISLALPRVMQREAYGKNHLETEDFQFEETLTGENHNNYLWGNAAYAMGLRITNAFNEYGWCAAIRGVEGGGLVENLPIHTYTNATGEKVIKCPTEVLITDRREKELSELGFQALCYKKHTNNSVFFDCPTVAKTKEYVDPKANANSYVAVQLNYILAASRFAHYLKVIMRDKIGSFTSKSEIQNFLNSWIVQYVLLIDDAPQYSRAKFPLREARVDVTEIEGKIGCYKAICYLRPHFQLNELTISIRMVAELPAPAA
jgi:type VI secretion system protein ImpC